MKYAANVDGRWVNAEGRLVREPIQLTPAKLFGALELGGFRTALVVPADVLAAGYAKGKLKLRTVCAIALTEADKGGK